MRRNERGAAVVELALFMLALLALTAVVGPLVIALKEQVKLGRTAGTTVNFATSVPDQRRRSCEGDQLGTRSPTTDEVIAEATCAHFGSPTGAPADFEVTVSPDPADPSVIAGTEITVTVERTVDMGIIGKFFLDDGELTLTSEQVGVKE